MLQTFATLILLATLTVQLRAQPRQSSLVDTLQYVYVDEALCQLHVYGRFEHQPGVVHINGLELEQVYWSDSEVVAIVPDTGTASGGVVTVVDHAGIESNQRLLSQYWCKADLGFENMHGNLTIHDSYHWRTYFRADCQPTTFTRGISTSVNHLSTFSYYISEMKQVGNDLSSADGSGTLPWMRADLPYDSGFSVSLYLTPGQPPYLSAERAFCRYQQTGPAIGVGRLLTPENVFNTTYSNGHIQPYSIKGELWGFRCSYYPSNVSVDLRMQSDSDRYVQAGSAEVQTQELPRPTSLTLSPTPFLNTLQLALPAHVALFDGLGRTVLSSDYLQGVVDVSSIPRGIYTAVIDVKNSTPIRQRLVKE